MVRLACSGSVSVSGILCCLSCCSFVGTLGILRHFVLLLHIWAGMWHSCTWAGVMLCLGLRTVIAGSSCRGNLCLPGEPVFFGMGLCGCSLVSCGVRELHRASFLPRPCGAVP